MENPAQATKYTGTYKIADINFYVSTSSPAFHQTCAEYATQESAQIHIQISPADLERASNDLMARPQYHNEENVESTAIYQKIFTTLMDYDCMLMHGVAIAVDGQGYIFTAKSGVGKSTHAFLWQKKFGSRAQIINGDKPVIRIVDGTPMVYGTPWCGKENLQTNTKVPLKAICLIGRDTTNHIEAIQPSEAFTPMLKQVYVGPDQQAMLKTFDIMDRISSKVKYYRLGCNMEPEAAEVSYNAMSQD